MSIINSADVNADLAGFGRLRAGYVPRLQHQPIHILIKIMWFFSSIC